MSAAAQAQAAALHQLEITLPGLDATKYLSAAGFVILLYDHMLLFSDEIRLIWQARLSWPKILFLVNRYSVPAFLSVTSYQLSGLSEGVTTNFCRTWLVATAFLTTVSLGIATVFVVQRVYALWGRSKQILAILIPAFATVYILAFFFAGLSTIRLIPHISYNPFVKTCIADERPTLLIAGFAAPVAFDIFLFVLTWLNALSRPRHMHTALVSQLHVDGAVFFVSLLTLRLFNIIVVAVAPLAYLQLGIYFLWAMITVVINRMLITISTSLPHPRSPDAPPGSPEHALFSQFDPLVEAAQCWSPSPDAGAGAEPAIRMHQVHQVHQVQVLELDYKRKFSASDAC